MTVKDGRHGLRLNEGGRPDVLLPLASLLLSLGGIAEKLHGELIESCIFRDVIDQNV